LLLLNLNTPLVKLKPQTLSLLWSRFKNVQLKTIGTNATFSLSKNTPIKDNWSKTLWDWDASQQQNLKLTMFLRSNLWNLFLQHWKISRPKTTTTYMIDCEFRLFFLSGSPDYRRTNLISANQYFKRWTDAYNLLFNLFYLNPFVQLFSNKIFLEESTIFNWHYGIKNIKLFKLTQPFFSFKDSPHGGFIHSAVETLLERKLDFLLLVDIKNHRRFLHYIQMYNIYVIGLIPINYSPWKISYPIPTFSDSYINQYYFIRWIFHIQIQTKKTKHLNKYTQWSMVKRINSI